MASRKWFTSQSMNCIEEFEELYVTEVWQCLTDLQKDKEGPAI